MDDFGQGRRVGFDGTGQWVAAERAKTDILSNGLFAGFKYEPVVVDENHYTVALDNGPLGLSWLRPQGLFGVEAEPLNHGVIFSLLANTLALIIASYVRKPLTIERMQAGTFSIRGKLALTAPERDGRVVTIAELKHSVGSYLGRERTNRAFDNYFDQEKPRIVDLRL